MATEELGPEIVVLSRSCLVIDSLPPRSIADFVGVNLDVGESLTEFVWEDVMRLRRGSWINARQTIRFTAQFQKSRLNSRRATACRP